MSSASVRTLLTVREYLDFERKAEFRHEYRDGEVVAMSGARRPHCLVVGNLFREIGNQLENRACEVYANDMRVCVDPTGLYTYPDLVVVCGEPELLDEEMDTLLNPTVLVEVLSPSTEAYDRGRKFERYRGIASLREYVLVSQDRINVEQFTLEEGRWTPRTLNRPEDTLRLDSIGCEVVVGRIYAKVPRLLDGPGGA